MLSGSFENSKPLYPLSRDTTIYKMKTRIKIKTKINKKRKTIQIKAAQIRQFVVV